ncbi:hypothetical protein GCM10010365_73200 [Streptomyces poonensis]|uniref:Uncharacterized protein n=1 Tax=Streptomyces poonensis TaxID=68255 RepID=A0A918QD98_9ACTN|nr:hypothetical protein GCM10010365_73200 [Streptomyces poonensis]
MHASGTGLNLTRLTGDMRFTSVEMGRDAATLDGSGARGVAGPTGSRRALTVHDLRLKACSLTAGTFSLTGPTCPYGEVCGCAHDPCVAAGHGLPSRHRCRCRARGVPARAPLSVESAGS